MNCLKCEKRIRTPRHDYTVAELVAMCRDHCLACNPNELPRVNRTPVRVSEFTVSQRVIDPCDEVPLSANQADADIEGVTPEAFDRLRKAMVTLFSLSPLDLLIVQHIFNGGVFSGVPQIVISLFRKCQRYHGSAKQMIYARKNKIISKFPQIEPALARKIAERGGDRRRIDE